MGEGARLVLVAAAAIAVAVLAPGLGFDTTDAWRLALITLTMGLWATAALPEATTALVFFLAAVAAGLAPPEVIFSGFASGAFWLVFAGVILGRAVGETGLGAILARRLLGGVRGPYPALVAGAIALGGVSAFVLPSTLGRIVLLLPVVLALADRFGLSEGRRGRTGLVLGFMLATFYLSTAILPANVPNMVLVGTAETVLGLGVRYGEYFSLHAPVQFLAKGGVLWAALVLLLPDRVTAEADPAPAPGWSPAAGRLAVILAAALALWVTDTLHGVSPGWVALAAGLLAVLPGIGVLPSRGFTKGLDPGPLIYIAGVLGVGGLVSQTDLGARLGAGLSAVLPVAPGADLANHLALSGAAMVLAAAVTTPGVPVVLMPAVPDLAAASGWAPEAVVMVQVAGYANAFLPYQVPPLVVGLALAGIGPWAAARIMLPVAAVGFLLLGPITVLWWRMLGFV